MQSAHHGCRESVVTGPSCGQEDALAKAEAELETRKLRMVLDHQLQTLQSTERDALSTEEHRVLEKVRTDFKRETAEVTVHLGAAGLSGAMVVA